MKPYSILIIMLVALTSCATPLAPTPTESPRPTQTFKPAPTETLTPIPTATPAPTFTPAPTVPPLPTFSGDPVFIGAGDIVDCFNAWSEKTAAIIEKTQGIVFTTGDNAYDSGSPDQFKIVTTSHGANLKIAPSRRWATTITARWARRDISTTSARWQEIG